MQISQMQYSKGMSIPGSLPSFSADNLVKSHLAIQVIKQFDLQIPMHFLTVKCRPQYQKLISPDNRLSLSQVFLEQLTSPVLY